MVERYTREDGKVAVLISPGHGAGWSTWAADEDVEFLLFDAKIVKAVLAGLDHIAGSLAVMQTYRPSENQNDSSDELDPAGAGADSNGGDPAGIVDADANSLGTEPIECSNSMARSESAKVVGYDASNKATVSETATLPTITSGNGMEGLNVDADYDQIDPRYRDSYERFASDNVFFHSARTLIIEWLDLGEEFKVNEYDGHESIMRKMTSKWNVA